MSRRPGVDILMYHSIATGGGPLSTAPDTFRRQLDALTGAGLRGIALREYLELRAAARPLDGVAVLTFDDGYGDFADVVVPEIVARGWTCTVFLSTSLVGSSGWDPDGGGARRLIDWAQAGAACGQGVEVGAHGVSHGDLTRMRPEDARREIAESRRVLEDRLRTAVVSFAAPYGLSTPTIRREIAREYRGAVGTTLARATTASDAFDLPRIDMWYFRSVRRWRAYLEGARTYFTLRQALRRVRSARPPANAR
jgi:peptidoglycan/xylan/chitin deacetylase (PgdA/CDA1 family)